MSKRTLIITFLKLSLAAPIACVKSVIKGGVFDPNGVTVADYLVLKGPHKPGAVLFFTEMEMPNFSGQGEKLVTKSLHLPVVTMRTVTDMFQLPGPGNTKIQLVPALSSRRNNYVPRSDSRTVAGSGAYTCKG